MSLFHLPRKRFPEASILAKKAQKAGAEAIDKAIIGKRHVPAWTLRSWPYLNAMIHKDYGLEDPAMVVLYALDNLTQWRGEEAQQVKQSMKALLTTERYND